MYNNSSSKRRTCELFYSDIIDKELMLLDVRTILVEKILLDISEIENLTIIFYYNEIFRDVFGCNVCPGCIQ